MRSLLDFIVEPVGSRYDNEVSIGDSKLIVNSSIEKFKFINRKAKVISVPMIYDGEIKVGDELIVHHNIFRRYYNQRGKAVDSSKHFIDNMYFCQLDQIYLVKVNGKWNAVGDRCFLAPIKNTSQFSTDKEQKCVGILKIGNSSLESIGVNVGDVLTFKKNREFEFLIDGNKLYCMESNDILFKHGHERKETEYNPSWAKSS